MPGTPEEMMSAVAASLADRTGLDIDEWVALVEASGVDPLDQPAVRAWLKDMHGLGQNSQWAIAYEVATRHGWREPTPEEYAAQIFSGAKEGLRPIFDAVRDIALGLGPDVRMQGRTGYIPFVRGRQFAAVAAPARNRVELGLRYVEDPPLSPRLTGKTFAQATHTLALASVDEVDAEVVAMLQEAYDQNG